MSDEPTGAAPEAGNAEPAPTTDAPDFSAVHDRVEQLAGQFGDFQQQIMARLPEPETEPEPDPWDQWLGQGEPDPEPEPQPAFDVDALRNAVQAEMRQAMGPLAEQLQALTTQQQLDKLYADIPQLRDDPEVRQATGQAVQQAVQQYPPEVANVLMNDPGFIRTIFEAQEGRKLAQAQQPPGPLSQLETAGGANPGGTGEEPSIVDQVMRLRAQVPKGFL